MVKANILVVDDEAVVLEGIHRILKGDRYHVDSCTCGSAVLDLLQEKDFNMVIIDLKMPGMSGMEVLKRIKVMQPEIPVIIAGYFTVDTIVDAIKNGAHDYIAKPFSPDQLREKVATVFEQIAAQTQILFDPNYS
jgi:DNA-binding NtrC family response regulator